VDIVVGQTHLRAGQAAQTGPRGMVRRVTKPADEQALMAAYIAGDRAAFGPLFDALAPRLLAFFLRAVSDRAVAEDLLQLTFERLHAARDRYRPGSPLRPWLFTIAARVRVDELRRRYRLPASADEDELDRVIDHEAMPPADEQLDQRARDEKVRAALDSLPASQRVVVHLHRFEGMTFGEIGAVLGVQEGAVRLRAFRAYGALRTLLLPLVKEGGES
jgi:RNA polymerase sigma-70 factor (ECF subfamily)